MKPVIIHRDIGNSSPKAALWHGVDAESALRTFPPASVHMVATSPPYWGHRDYDAEGQLGLEPTPRAYVNRLVRIMREVKRVLRPDGSLWLNLGDSFWTTPKQGHFKPKDITGIPWLAAFALRADGWWLRRDIVWEKTNPIPESVGDRPATSHEYLFLLTPTDNYYYDGFAIRETAAPPDKAQKGDAPTTRARRSVWTMATESYTGAHCAVWPSELVRLMVRAGTSEKGCCATCGTPLRRVTEVIGKAEYQWADRTTKPWHKDGREIPQKNITQQLHQTVGWEPACQCGAGIARSTILHPFSGPATTGDVTLAEGRDYIGLDLDPDLSLARARLEGRAPPRAADPEPDPITDLFG